MKTEDLTPSGFAALIAGYEKTRDRYWITRTLICICTITSLFVGITSPISLSARALEATGDIGFWLIWVLMALSVCTLFETLLAHFSPPHQINFLRDRRHLLFMAIAVGQLCVAYAVYRYSRESASLIVVFARDATFATVVAFLDLFSRHKASRSCSL